MFPLKDLPICSQNDLKLYQSSIVSIVKTDMGTTNSILNESSKAYSNSSGTSSLKSANVITKLALNTLSESCLSQLNYDGAFNALVCLLKIICVSFCAYPNCWLCSVYWDIIDE